MQVREIVLRLLCAKSNSFIGQGTMLVASGEGLAWAAIVRLVRSGGQRIDFWVILESCTATGRPGCLVL